MKISKKFRFVGESVLIGLGYFFIPFLSRRMVVAFSARLGDMSYRFSASMRNVAMANLDIAYGTDISVDRKQEIIRGSFRTFALLLMDLFWFGRFTEKRIRKWVKFDSSYDHYFSNSPAIVVTGHIGNWEVLGQAVALYGAPCTSVAAPLENPLANWMVVRLRRVTGQEVAGREGAIKTIMKTLRDGGRTALLMDQNTLPEDGGRFVEFFGLRVPNSDAVETLAARTDAPVVFVYCVADDNGVYRGYAMSAFKADGNSDGDITRRIARMTEEVIRKHPEKWLWMYKRWKFIPPGDAQDSYPFYARAVGGK